MRFDVRPEAMPWSTTTIPQASDNDDEMFNDKINKIK